MNHIDNFTSKQLGKRLNKVYFAGKISPDYLNCPADIIEIYHGYNLVYDNFEAIMGGNLDYFQTNEKELIRALPMAEDIYNQAYLDLIEKGLPIEMIKELPAAEVVFLGGLPIFEHWEHTISLSQIFASFAMLELANYNELVFQIKTETNRDIGNQNKEIVNRAKDAISRAKTSAIHAQTYMGLFRENITEKVLRESKEDLVLESELTSSKRRYAGKQKIYSPFTALIMGIVNEEIDSEMTQKEAREQIASEISKQDPGGKKRKPDAKTYRIWRTEAMAHRKTIH